MKAKNGISLIVLVITIVVIIILAAAVILSLGDNNPINSAKVSALVSTQDSIGSAILNVVSTRYGTYAATDNDTSAVAMLQKTTAVIDTTANAITGLDTKTASSITAVKLYKILDDGWAVLGMTKPDTNTWYFGSNGKVYVDLAGDAADTDLSNENGSTKLFTLATY